MADSFDFLGATVGDKGEKSCPLCAEEMDLTDQQLKPCKCGYEICVWCWNHIMDMAEKEETDGRCPACRTPYDKEKIVGMAANCERLVAEIKMERKKSQKAKTKTSEGRKHLSSVRVIQRNLVYIVGLPLNLADEDLLQHKEYFGQYGKVLKVSISRTSAGTIQQFAESSCSAYITYSKEEEAIRCIQSVYGFILEGRPLRACFGTTKYCHAWLRNVPCTNPDCLYLHEIGSEEDSFTKDEIFSAYTRVKQITGAANIMQRRSGSVLPPPADDYCSYSCSGTGKPPVKSGANVQSLATSRGSPPNSSSGRSGVLPATASWGTCASNCQSSDGSLVCSNGPSKHRPDLAGAAGPSIALSTTVVGTSCGSSLVSDVGKRLMLPEEGHLRQHTNKMESSENVKHHYGENARTNVSEISAISLGARASMTSAGWLPSSAETAENNRDIKMPRNGSHYADRQSDICDVGKETNASTDGKVQKLCSDMPSMTTDKRLDGEHPDIIHPNGLHLDNFMSSGAQGLQRQDSEKLQAHLASLVVSKAATPVDGTSASRDARDWQSDIVMPMLNVSSGMLDKFDHQSSDAIVDNQTSLPNSSLSLHFLNNFSSLLQHADAVNDDANPAIVNRKAGESLATNVSTASVVSNGYLENSVSGTSSLDYISILSNGGKENVAGRFFSEVSIVDSSPCLDMESSIISNILSLDLDSLDDPLTSPQNLVKLLGEPDKQHGSLKLPSPWKAQNSNQSRFSFARQDEPRNQLFDVEPSFSNTVPTSMNNSFSHTFFENREPYLQRLGNGIGFYQGNVELSDDISSSNSIFSAIKPSGSRAQISAPPGFFVPSRPPPPGFSSQDRNDQYFDLKTDNYSLETSSLARNRYQASPTGNTSVAGDIEFMDPAILAVGKGRLNSGGINKSGLDMQRIFPSQAPSENDTNLQLLIQQSLTPHQNLRYTEVMDSFSPLNNAYGFSSRHMEQTQACNPSTLTRFSLHSRNAVMSNGHWDDWNELKAGNDSGIAEILRNDRLGFNKLYSGFEDSKFQMPSSANLSYRTFGM
ncbi:hypothetical protein Ancab_008262 [Ancistrocladus abbreviatus]